MNFWVWSLLVCSLSLNAVAAEKPPFAGTWEATINDLPGVKIKIEESGGRLGGTVVFFFHRRGDDGKWHVEGDNRGGPMLVPRLQGKVLTFEVTHHKTHGSSELGPNVKFRLELMGANEARLRQVEDQPDAPGTGLRLTRRR